VTSVANAEAVSKEMLQYDGPSGGTSQGHLVSDAVGGAAANVMPGFSGCGQANAECKTYTYDGDGRLKPGQLQTGPVIPLDGAPLLDS
jgi:hypothetical protein